MASFSDAAPGNADPEDELELLELLGEGAYGAVYKARRLYKDELVAVKIIPLDGGSDLRKELDIMMSCRCPYIVALHNVFHKDNEAWLVMDYCGGGSASDVMEAAGVTLSEEEVRCCVAWCLLGLDFLHGRRKLHRDVKAGNVLLTDSGAAKLADFGVSREVTSSNNGKAQTVIGTPYWMAPEIIQEVPYDGRADVWSLGITAIELAEGHPPHHKVHPMRAIFLIPSRPPPTLREPENWSPEFRNFLEHCLCKKMEDRPTAAALLEHPWVAAAAREIAAEGGRRGSPVLRDLVARHAGELEAFRAAASAAKAADEGGINGGVGGDGGNGAGNGQNGQTVGVGGSSGGGGSGGEEPHRATLRQHHSGSGHAGGRASGRAIGGGIGGGSGLVSGPNTAAGGGSYGTGPDGSGALTLANICASPHASADGEPSPRNPFSDTGGSVCSTISTGSVIRLGDDFDHDPTERFSGNGAGGSAATAAAGAQGLRTSSDNDTINMSHRGGGASRSSSPPERPVRQAAAEPPDTSVMANLRAAARYFGVGATSGKPAPLVAAAAPAVGGAAAAPGSAASAPSSPAAIYAEATVPGTAAGTAAAGANPAAIALPTREGAAATITTVADSEMRGGAAAGWCGAAASADSDAAGAISPRRGGGLSRALQALEQQFEADVGRLRALYIQKKSELEEDGVAGSVGGGAAGATTSAVAMAAVAGGAGASPALVPPAGTVAR